MKSDVWEGALPLLVALHGPSFPSDHEWQRHLDVARGVNARLGDGVPFRILVLSDGGGPTAAQRAGLTERAGRRQARGALVTSSQMAASIGTVMGLTYPGMKIFLPRDIHRVLAHLDIAHAELPSLLDHIHAANDGLGLECVAEIAATLAPGS